MAKNNDMRYVMKVMYWLAIGAIVLFIGYIGFEIFTTVYGGIKG